jgi:hypothetical protein
MLMTRAFWDALLNLVKKSFCTIHVYIFFQGSLDLDAQAPFTIRSIFPYGAIEIEDTSYSEWLLSIFGENGWRLKT